jgi:ATP-dependent Zn protease
VTDNVDTVARQANAFHEAGHAVVAVILNEPVLYVCLPTHPKSVNGGPLMLGFMRTRRIAKNDRNLERIQIRLLASIHSSFAGPLAESKAIGRAFDIPGAQADFQNAARVAEHLCDGDKARTLELLEAASKKSHELISDPQNWSAICAVAEMLLRTGKVSGREIRAVLQANGEPAQ